MLAETRRLWAVWTMLALKTELEALELACTALDRCPTGGKLLRRFEDGAADVRRGGQGGA